MAEDNVQARSPSTSTRGASEDYVNKKINEILDKHGGDKTQFKKSMKCVGLWPEPIANTSKIFSDPIHGNITIHPVCVAVINTPEFQRLRDLKQLGVNSFVYPGATHSRFEHSLGACYLAGKFVRQLKENQPELEINNKDILCLELAGLCHDLGHGPYSHVFDGKVVPQLEKPKTGSEDKKKKWSRLRGSCFESWCYRSDWVNIATKVIIHREDETWQVHEKASVHLFDYIYNKEEHKTVRDAFETYCLDERERNFIKALITGESPERAGTDQDKKLLYERTGRNKDKNFLYEIVANELNGIDVDKWDYIARDCHQLGIRSTFDHSRFMKFARVKFVEKDGEKHICVRDKELINVYDLFTSRYLLHKNSYQHKVISALEIIISEIAVFEESSRLSVARESALRRQNGTVKHFSLQRVAQALSKADKHLLVGGSSGKRMSKIIEEEDWEKYILLTDNILFKIRDNDDNSQEMKEAKAIIDRIFSRQFFKCVGESPPFKPQDPKEDNTDKEKRIKQRIRKEDDFFVQVVNLDFGKKEKNPLDNIHVYNKNDEVIKVPYEMSTILKPYTFKEQIIRVYVKDENNMDVIKQAFENWIKTDFEKEKAKEKAPVCAKCQGPV